MTAPAGTAPAVVSPGTSARPQPAPSRRFVVTVTAATTLLIGLTVTGIVLNAIAPSPDRTRVAQFFYDGGPIVFLAVGGLLVIRRPGNVSAWAMWVLGGAMMSGTLTQGLLNDGAAGIAVPQSWLAWAAWLNNSTWLLWFLSLFILLLHFPEGRLPGRFWRRLELLACVDVAAGTLICAAVRTDAADYPGITFPVDLGPLSRLPPRTVNAIVMIAFVVMIAAMAATLVGIGLRFRRARGTERAQLKWLFLGAGFGIGMLALMTLLNGIAAAHLPVWLSDTGDVVELASLWMLPLTIAVAVTRHGLFEIDRLVSRTVSYAVLVGVLAGAYVLVVGTVSALVPGRWGSVPVVLATLAVSALFLPVRRWVVRVVDHRFNRSKYDAAAVVAQFAERVRGGAGQGTTSEDLVAAARQVLQPAHASVWLRPPMAPAASSPAGSIGSSGSYASGERA